MSEKLIPVKQGEFIWYPAAFPLTGKLPNSPEQVTDNQRLQNSMEAEYRQEINLAAGKRQIPPCCKTLHISLFFDGTGNNLNNDLNLSKPAHPTNVARLFQATIGTGDVGGVPKSRSGMSPLLDDEQGLEKKFYKYYIPGVGTPFPEIHDLEYGMPGLAFARYGEERINWGLLSIIDALSRSLNNKALSIEKKRAAIDEMSTAMLTMGVTGPRNRAETFYRLFNELLPALKIARSQPEPGKQKLLGIKLYIYGFSRGAAEARTFVNWLSQLLPAPAAGQQQSPHCLQAKGESDPECSLPVSIAFLGLFDTVASVGIAHVAPVAEGHMGWADGTQVLPDEKRYAGLIKRCVHLVSAHEQRLSFPLDSLRRTDGSYPQGSIEVLYPGMHSDLGGGYTPGDQGKGGTPALTPEEKQASNDGLLLSQIALHEMYAAAFMSGAPLKVLKSILPENLKNDTWRSMPFGLISQFIVIEELVHRFNAWRKVTLNLDSDGHISPEAAAAFMPIKSSVTLETEMENQLAWLTAWRINRYARLTLQQQPFYRQATDTQSAPDVRSAAEEARDERQRKIDAQNKRRLEEAKQNKEDSRSVILQPGVKDFDPDMNKVQLREAAEEFRADYFDLMRPQNAFWGQVVLDTALKNTIYLLNSDDEILEYRHIKADAEVRVGRLFPAAGEASNASEPEGLLRALYDDQVHDSRAWFMHSTLGGREPWGGYFRYRMVYFDKACNKSLSPLAIAGNVVGFATVVGGITLILRQRTAGKVLGAAVGMAGTRWLQIEAIEKLTGDVVPRLPGVIDEMAFTSTPGEAVQQQRLAMQKRQAQQVVDNIDRYWKARKRTTALA